MAMLVHFILLLMICWKCGLIQSEPAFDCDLRHSDGTCLKHHNMNGESINEAMSISDVLYTLNASDNASGVSVTYGIIPTDPSNLPADTKDGFLYLNVNGLSGDVTIKSELDYEKFREIRPTWELTSNETYTNCVHVYVADENDNYPLLQGLPYDDVNLLENTTIGHIVFHDVLATDNDITEEFHTITYHLVGNIHSYSFECETSVFDIDQNLGSVVLRSPISYKTSTSYTICIEARDQGDPFLANYTTLTIDVVDIQGDPPVFRSTPYQKLVSEDIPVNNTVLTVIAEDGDYGVPSPNPIDFHIVAGDDRGDFIMNSLGELRIRNALDIERKPNYTLFVQATELDPSQPPEDITSFETISIFLTDVNDNQPVFNPSSATIELQENPPEMTSLDLSILAIDADVEDVNAYFELSLSDPEIFHLVKNSVIGSTLVDVLVLDNTFLDAEKRKDVDFTLYATAPGDVNPTSTAHIKVILEDVNDNPPIFPMDSSYECSVNDGGKLGNKTGHDCQVEALDADITEMNKDVNYTILSSSPAVEIFDINTKSGIISIIGNLKLIDGLTSIQLKVGAENTASPYHSVTTEVLIDATLHEPKEPTNTGLIVGLSTGIAVGLIVLILILLCVVNKKKSKQTHVLPSTADLLGGDAEFGSSNMGSRAAWSTPDHEDNVDDGTTTTPQINHQLVSSDNGNHYTLDPTIGDSNHTTNATDSSTNVPQYEVVIHRQSSGKSPVNGTEDQLNISQHTTNATDSSTNVPQYEVVIQRQSSGKSPVNGTDDQLNISQSGGKSRLNMADDMTHPPSTSTESSFPPNISTGFPLPPITSSNNSGGKLDPLDLSPNTTSNKHKKRSKRRNRRPAKLLKPSANAQELSEQELIALGLSIQSSPSSDRRRKSLTPLPSENEDDNDKESVHGYSSF